MTSKHTPGPWSCTYYEYPDQWAIYEGSGGNQLAIVYDKANGALIAAAPETAAERDSLREENVILKAALIAVVTETVAEQDSLKALNAELLKALPNPHKLELLAKLSNIIIQDDLRCWAVNIRTVIAKAKELKIW